MYTADLANIGKNTFELAAVGNFQARFDPRIQAIRPAFQVANIGTGAADDRGDFGKKAGAILGANSQLHRKGRSAFAAPFDGDATFGLVHQILHIGTSASVDGNAAAAGDVPDNFVAGNWIATLGAKNEQVIMALHDKRRFADAEHPLDGFDERGPGIIHFGSRRLSR